MQIYNRKIFIFFMILSLVSPQYAFAASEAVTDISGVELPSRFVTNFPYHIHCKNSGFYLTAKENGDIYQEKNEEAKRTNHNVWILKKSRINGLYFIETQNSRHQVCASDIQTGAPIIQTKLAEEQFERENKMWSLEEKSGFLFLKNKGSGHLLNGWGTSSSVTQQSESSLDAYIFESHRLWKLSPAGCMLNASISNFNFGNNIGAILANSSPKCIMTRNLDVSEDGITVDVKHSFSQTFTDSYKWSFTDKLGLSTKLSINCSIPFIDGIIVSASSNFDLSASQETATSTSNTTNPSIHVSFAKRGRYRVSSIFYSQQDINLPFVAEVIFSGSKVGTTEVSPLSAEAVLALMFHEGIDIKGIENNTPETVRLMVSGTLKTSFCVRGEDKIEKLD